MFSSGAGSWAAARRVVEEHGAEELFLVFADVLGEDIDNYRFLGDAAADVGGELVWITEGRTIWDVFHDNRFLGNSRLANCSKFLKQQPARKWLDENCDPADTTVYVGIDWSEVDRMDSIHKGYVPFKVKAPMTEPPMWDKRRVLREMRLRGLEPPRMYGMGFAHANCGGGCVRAGQGQFLQLLRVMPDRFAEWEANEQSLRKFLDADVAILRDRTARGVRPLTLRELRDRAEWDDPQLDLFDIGGCGCFVAEASDAR